MTRPAAVVIGAGVNELVAAHCLARAGCPVTLVAAAGAQAHEAGWVSSRIVRELDLDAAKLGPSHADPWASVPLEAGGFLELTGDIAATAEAIRRVSARDAQRWPDFCERMQRYAGVLEALYMEPPPDPLAGDVRGIARLLRGGLRLRRLGARDIHAFLQLLPMSVADFLDDWFESDALKGVLAAAGVMHGFHGPRSGGTAFNLLHHHVGAAPGVFRPPLTRLPAALSEKEGVRRLEGAVAHIEVAEARVKAVVLASGVRLEAGVVVSGQPPAEALLTLIDPGLLDPELVRALRNVRSRGVVAFMDLVLDRSPEFRTLVVAPGLDYLERAYDDAKYGRISSAPYVEARVVGVSDSGKTRLRAHVQYVPHALRKAVWTADSARAFGRDIVSHLDRHVPGFAESVIEQRVMTPQDLEHVHGWPQGQAYHAELALDQLLWMRPVPELAQYRTPIEGFYLCGHAMHPGAGTAGAAGANAASVILRDL